MDIQPLNELTRQINLERVFHNRSQYIVTASEEERQALAKRFDLVSVDFLEARYDFKPAETNRGGFYVTGNLRAEVVQKCVATLVPVKEKIETEISLQVVDEKYAVENPLDPEQDEDFEYSSQGEIDLGEITAQYLSLSLNPYPRAPEADDKLEADKMNEKQNPFSVLEKLRS